jgi:transcriptional regulator with XRE-family HTH domain/quercetin dioxygenase-like cupin family protein
VPRAADPQVGERIREERTKRGVTLRGLARGVGVSASLISQIETGKCQPSVGTLYAITTTLGISVEDVFQPAGAADDECAGTASAPAGAPPVSAPPVSAPPVSAPPLGAPPLGAPPLGAPPLGAPSAGAPPAPLPAANVPAAPTAVLAAVRSDSVVGRQNEREVLRLDSGVTWERLGHVPGVQADFLLVTYAPGGSSSDHGQFMRHAGAEYGYLMEGELILTLGAEEHRLTAGQSVCFPSSTPHRYRNDAARPAVGVWFVSGQDSSVFSIH